MITAVAFVLAAAAGVLVRAEAGRRWNRHDGFSTGTLVVNVTGSFLLGLLAGAAPLTLTVLGIGALGACTSFSSFARDAAALSARQRVGVAAVYVILTCSLGIAGAAAGVAIAT